MAKLIGTAPNQVPTNADLGSLAYMDKDNFDANISELTLGALSREITDTAVDIFVYDTRKDSDGGAWRKRTQHTSWYNEGASATRGSRKEFPAVAVIVAESNQVTIYDGDDPDLPMWMVFELGINKAIGFGSGGTNTTTSCHMLNGLMFVGAEDTTNSNPYSGYINFITEQNRQYGAGTYDIFRGIVDRNSSTLPYQLLASSYNIVDPTVNDVAMTVLPNAPIDAATGLPVPTIAVATNAGMSVINNDGTVANSSYTNAFKKIVANEDGFAFSFRDFENFGVVSFDRVASSSWSADISNIYYGAGGGMSPLATSHSSTNAIDAIAAYSQGNNLGVTNWDWKLPAEGYYAKLFNYTTSSYNTGWMNGDIKLATLSDTDDTDVTGSELVTNGTFDSDLTGWTVGGTGATAAVVSGQAVLTRNGTSAKLFQNFTTEVGKTYTITVDFVGATGGAYFYGFFSGGSVGTAVTNTTGTYTLTGVAGSTSEYFQVNIYNTNSGTLTFDNVSIRLAEEDRSVNGNGLQVFGSITKNPVATGADLVAYSGFSSSNYLEQPVNSDLTGAYDSCFMGWMKTSSTSSYQYLFSLGSSGADVFGLAVQITTGYLYAYDDVNGQQPSSTNVADGVWHHVCLVHKNGVNKQIYVDGKLINTSSTSSYTHSSNAKYRVGRYFTYPNDFEGSLALQRFSKTIPSPEQIKKIYEDEKVLFQENAQATLYGSSDAVTALAYDDSTNLLHVGTSAGRSVFQGLRRVDNTTTAVGAAISASNGLVADE